MLSTVYGKFCIADRDIKRKQNFASDETYFYHEFFNKFPVTSSIVLKNFILEWRFFITKVAQKFPLIDVQFI